VSALKIGRSPNLGRFGSLLLVLLLLLLYQPFAEVRGPNINALSVIFSFMLVSGVYSVSRRRGVVVGALLLGLPALGFEWFSNFYPNPLMVATNLALLGAFVSYVAIVIFIEVLREEEHVTTDTILGGIAIYLLLGLAWAFFYGIAEHLQPGSIPIKGTPLQELREPFEFLFPELIYFSFVTVTTLGYGDISPASPFARSLAIFEAIVGQLYVAIFIARLVGLHIAAARRAD